MVALYYSSQQSYSASSTHLHNVFSHSFIPFQHKQLQNSSLPLEPHHNIPHSQPQITTPYSQLWRLSHEHTCSSLWINRFIIQNNNNNTLSAHRVSVPFSHQTNVLSPLLHQSHKSCVGISYIQPFTHTPIHRIHTFPWLINPLSLQPHYYSYSYPISTKDDRDR